MAYINWRTALVFVYFLFAMMVSIPIYAKESLLIIRAQGKNFDDAVLGLKEELTKDFVLNELIVNTRTSKYKIARKMRKVSPKMVVLMNNVSMTLYKKYQKGLPKKAFVVPSVSIMASFMDIAIKGLRNARGISYEVPLVTSIVNLRAILPSVSFDRIGIVNRTFIVSSIRINQKYCAREKIRLISYPIPNRRNITRNLKRALNKLRKDKVDALWVPNDDKLVNAKMLKYVWIPFARRFRKPIVTGVAILVNPKFKFGTFAVIPDHVQLGNQAAQIIFDTMENHWQVEKAGKVEPPRSVYKIINLKQAEHLFDVNKEKLENIVDKVFTVP